MTSDAGSRPFEKWLAGSAPVTVVMITLNEAHNLEAVLKNLDGWAGDIFIVDSYSKDETVDIALRFGATIVRENSLILVINGILRSTMLLSIFRG